MGVLYTILLIGGVILVHELGHYLVARWMGIHVVEFSIGFGPRLAVIRGKKRHPTLKPTEYSIALLPFGGFVKMLGYDPTDKVPEGAESVAFGSKPVWRRFLVMFAGPAFNLILPLILFFSVHLATSQTLPAKVADTNYDSPAYKVGMRAGDRITAIEGEPIAYWWQLSDAIDPRHDQPTLIEWTDIQGKQHSATIVPRAEEKVIIPGFYSYPVGRIGVAASAYIPIVAVIPGTPAAAAGIANWDTVVAVDGQPVDQVKVMLKLVEAAADREVRLRVLHYEPAATASPFSVAAARARDVVLPPVAAGADPLRGLFAGDRAVWRVVPGSPAEELGIQPGDELVSVAGQPWDSATFALSLLDRHRNKEPVALVVRRNGVELPPMKLAQRQMDAPHELDKTAKQWVHGLVVQSEPGSPTMRGIEPVPNDARFAYAWNQTFKSFGGVLENVVGTLGGLLTGNVSVAEGLGGPVQIANVAAYAGSKGWDYFLTVMAMISISIGLVNLLPIPVLDGGQILFLALEGIRRKPVSMRTRMIAIYASLAFIIVLMVIVIRNDVIKVMG